MTETKCDIKSLSYDEVLQFVSECGEKPFRGKQLYQWMHVHKVAAYEEMTNLPGKFLDTLRERTIYTSLRQVQCQISQEDGTRKYLFALADGNVVESVLMHYKHGNSVCVSSQVGCRMGCRFCASTLDGLERNLTASEILEQIYAISRDTGERISHVVVMGTGEPLDNYDNLLRFLSLISDEHGANISQRNITVSTCGLVPKMRQLAEEGLQITLALSLHASNQKKRQELMPVANSYEIHQVIDACRYYFEKTGRRITFEYSLVGGVNDGEEDAKELAELLRGLNCHVNLIPVNPIKERDFTQSNHQVILAFKNKLEKYGINVTIRRTLGADINASCGQLRKKYIKSMEIQ
jgi:23S rRNA (adenine2503-C2)-methyltransferase